MILRVLGILARYPSDLKMGHLGQRFGFYFDFEVLFQNIWFLVIGLLIIHFGNDLTYLIIKVGKFYSNFRIKIKHRFSLLSLKISFYTSKINL